MEALSINLHNCVKAISDTIDYLVPEEITVREFAYLLKKKNLQLHVSYGSGGFCCSLVSHDARYFVGYSYDILEAIKRALIKYNDYLEFDSDDEDVTKPDMRFSDVAHKYSR